MRAAARETMISNMALVQVISIGFLVPKAAAQLDKYSKMAPVNQYLMLERYRDSEALLEHHANLGDTMDALLEWLVRRTLSWLIRSSLIQALHSTRNLLQSVNIS